MVEHQSVLNAGESLFSQECGGLPVSIGSETHLAGGFLVPNQGLLLDLQAWVSSADLPCPAPLAPALSPTTGPG